MSTQYRPTFSIPAAVASAVILHVALASGYLYAQKLNPAPNPSFEDDLGGIKSKLCVFGGWFPIGAVDDEGQSLIEIVEDVSRSGKKSLRVKPNPAVVRGTIYYSQHNGGEEVRKNVKRPGVSGARTLAFRLDRDILFCDASVWVKAAEKQKIVLKAVWYTRRDRVPFIKIHEQAVSEPVETDGPWRRYALRAVRPQSARQVQIAVESDGTEPFHIDDARIEFERQPHVDVLVDQLGYETGSKAKTIILQSSTPLKIPPRSLAIIDLETFKTVYEGEWTDRGYKADWDLYHWEADVSDLKRPGRYVARARVGKQTHYSPPFEIAADLLLARTAEPAYRFFYYQRCGQAVPGFHAACHLDDAKTSGGAQRDLSGGWHDAGDYNKYNGCTPESLYALALAYDRRKEFFDRFDRDQNGRADILDEAVWGAEFLDKCLDPKSLEAIAAVSTGYGYWGPPEEETDNTPGSGDERPITEGKGDAAAFIAGYALLGKHLPDGQKRIRLAERLFKKYGGGMDRILALHAATGNAKYRDMAHKRVKSMLAAGPGATGSFRELGQYALAFPKCDSIPKIKAVAKLRLAQLESICDNTFRIRRRSAGKGKWAFFLHYKDVNAWHVGETRELLDAAYEGILLDKLGFPQGRTIARQQVHWILGKNPYGVSMMEGIGTAFVPIYHHRYDAIPGNPRGAVPGAVINGITRLCPHLDRPWLDMHPEPKSDYQSNEPWLPHNNRWLFLVSIW